MVGRPSRWPLAHISSFLYVLPVAVAQSFFDNSAIRYILPVVWIMSYLPLMGHMARG